MSNPSDTPPPAPSAKEDTTVALLAYITIIGFIIAIVMHGNKKTQPFQLKHEKTRGSTSCPFCFFGM